VSADFSIGAFEEGDFDRLARLFSREFQADDKLLSAAYTKWLYADNPHGPAQIVRASEDGEWVGFLAAIPVRLAREGTQRTAYYVVNVLVDPAQRGKKVFDRMIEVAAAHAQSEGAMLMGHPNPAAMGAWRRAKMRFQAPLKATIATPTAIFRPQLRREAVAEARRLALSVELYNARTSHASKWRLLLTTDYLDWRFLRHPTNHYRLTDISNGDEPLGFIVTKRLRSFLHLMIDDFMLDDFGGAGFVSAPFATVVFVTEAVGAASHELLPCPVRKEIPYFCTAFGDDAGEHSFRLGLSATDF